MKAVRDSILAMLFLLGACNKEEPLDTDKYRECRIAYNGVRVSYNEPCPESAQQFEELTGNRVEKRGNKWFVWSTTFEDYLIETTLEPLDCYAIGF